MTMDPQQPVSVVVVDDSPLVRSVLRSVLTSAVGCEVVGEAGDGQEAVRLAISLRPQVITMDLAMPRLNGLEAITRIMSEAPTRILVVSDPSASVEAARAFDAVARGALDVMTKPSAWVRREKERLIATVRRLASVPVVFHPRGAFESRRPQPLALPAHPKSPGVIVIGASTGGPRALHRLLAGRGADFPIPMVIVQHLGEDFATGFIDWLGTATTLSVREATAARSLTAGQVLVGVRGGHVTLSAAGRIYISDAPARDGHRPAIDTLFESAADVFGGSAVGVLLTGMGSDGAHGLARIRAAGGVTVAQDEASCTVFGMPKVAIELGAAGAVLNLEQIRHFLDVLAGSARPPARAAGTAAGGGG